MRRVLNYTTVLALVLTVSSTALADERSTVEMTVKLPDEPPSLRKVNEGDYSLRVQLKNTGKKKVTLWPYLTVTVLDSQQKAVQKSMSIGRFGFRTTPSIIEGVPFVTVEPGDTHEIEVNLKRYTFDPRFITGWRLPGPGKYEVALSYEFKRAAAKKEFGRGCKDLDRADAPWNVALEVSETEKLKLDVKR